MTLTLHVPEPDPPIRLGRVYTDEAEYVWTNRGWISEVDPEQAELLTMIGYGNDLNSALSGAYDDVLKKVSRAIQGSKWESFMAKCSDPERIC